MFAALRRSKRRSATRVAALRILSVPSWHLLNCAQSASVPPPFTSTTLGSLVAVPAPFPRAVCRKSSQRPVCNLTPHSAVWRHLAPSSLLPVNWDRTPKPRSSDRLNLSFGSSNPRCTPPIVCSIPARAPRGARALLLYIHIHVSLWSRADFQFAMS